MAHLVVTYPRHEGANFDADYYRNTHIPLVERAWGPAGMTGAQILWPADDSQPFAAMVVLSFADSAAIDAAMGSPATPEVLGDVPKFTNIQPVLYRSQ